MLGIRHTLSGRLGSVVGLGCFPGVVGRFKSCSQSGVNSGAGGGVGIDVFVLIGRGPRQASSCSSGSETGGAADRGEPTVLEGVS